MNQKFNLRQLAALAAAFVGTATANECSAAPVQVNSSHQTGSIVRPAPLPPIVSARSQQAQPRAKNQPATALPPIVSAASASKKPSPALSKLPPIVDATSQTKPATTAGKLPPIVRSAPIRSSNMLAPLAASATKPIAAPKIDALASNRLKPAATDETKTPPLPTVIPTKLLAIGKASKTPTKIQPAQSVETAAKWTQQPKPKQILSAAGIPIYPAGHELNRPQPKSSATVKNASPVITPAAKSVAVAPPAIKTAKKPEPVISKAPTISPKSALITPIDPVTPILSSPPALSPPTAPKKQGSLTKSQDYFEVPPAEAPVVQANCSSCGDAGCSSCGIASHAGGCVAGCQSCGDGGCFDPNVVASQFAASGSVYSARRYLIADALVFTRDDGFLATSNVGSLDNFDFDGGLRVTLGSREDAVNGREVTYFGTAPIEQSEVRTSPAGLINSTFAAPLLGPPLPPGNFTAADVSAFLGANVQTEVKGSQIHSLEFNRVRWGWDVVKNFVGLRYIYFQDDFSVNSVDTGLAAGLDPSEGDFSIQTINNFFGPHIGGELFYDVGRRLSWSLYGKAGIYLNLNQLETSLTNTVLGFPTVTLIDNEDEDASVAGTLELGFTGHYQITQSSRFRLGYNLLWLGGVNTVSDNFPTIITPGTGLSADDDGDAFFHGLSVGFEIYR